MSTSGSIVENDINNNKNPIDEWTLSDLQSCFRKIFTKIGSNGELNDFLMLLAFLRLGSHRIKDSIEDYDAAITALTKVIAMESAQWAEIEKGSPMHFQKIEVYGYRGTMYLQKNDYGHAFEDFTKVIEGNPKSTLLQDVYLQRSIVSLMTNDPESSEKDFCKAVESGLSAVNAYVKRAEFYKEIKDNKHALEDYLQASNHDPANPDLFIEIGRAYWKSWKNNEALSAFSAALKHHPEKDKVIDFLNDEVSNIANKVLPDEIAYVRLSNGDSLSNKLLELYNVVIEEYPGMPDGYFNRGIYFMIINNYEKAAEDFSSFLQICNDDIFVTFILGICYDKLRNKAKATELFKRIIQGEIIDKIKKIKCELEKYTPVQNEINYNLFLEEIGKISSIEETLRALFDLFDLKWEATLSEDLLKFAIKLSALHSDPYALSSLSAQIIDDVFYFYPDYSDSPKAVLERDGWPVFTINVKLSIVEYLISRTNIRDWGDIHDGLSHEDTNGFLFKIHEYYLNQYENFIKCYLHFSKQLQYQVIEINKKKIQEEAQARLDERNKVIADLSHSIKNLIATVIDPLENMKQEKIGEPLIIQNALRGANLVRGIVNAMNLSFKGSIDDFYFDATHNTGRDSMNLETIMMESLKYSVSNMFDGKYFSNFMHNYFPEREIFQQAKELWADISQTNQWSKLLSFLEHYFFHIEISKNSGNQYILGNEKGSAIKMLILFQELVFNAVKYSASVEKESRFLKIDLTIELDRIAIRVVNRFKEHLVMKTSGIGHIIIGNFAKLLESQPIVSQENGVYSIELSFNNLWGAKHEDIVRR